MSILQAIKGKIAEWIGAVPVIGKGYVDATYSSGVIKMFNISHERTAIHKDMERMDADDEIVTFALNTIASRSMGYEDQTIDGFTVVARDKKTNELNEQANELIESLIERCSLRSHGWQVIRKAAKYGNYFDEVVLSKDGEGSAIGIAGLQPLPEHTVWPKTNEAGKRVPGYEQRQENSTSNAIQFNDMEIVHYAFGEINDYLGTPLMKCARKNWKRLNLALDFTALARLIRAFAKWVHRVPVKDTWSPQQQKEAIDAYKEVMSKRAIFDSTQISLEKEPYPQTVYTDFYIPDDGSGRGGVEMLDPENAQLQNIKDIEHFTDRVIVATHVPKRYYPFEGSTPKLSEGGGNAEDKQFACLLMMCQMLLKKGYEKLFNIELTLNGIDPDTIKYEWRMAQISTIDAYRVSQTNVNNARSLEIWLNKYPELATHLDVILREFSAMSDVSKAALAKVEVKEREYEPKATGGTRAQLPSAGAGPEGRSQV